MTLYAQEFPTPLGPMVACTDERGALVWLAFHDRLDAPEAGATGARAGERVIQDGTRCAPVIAQLDEYFRGARREFDLELAPRGSPFQLRVWEELRRIPYGTTISYRELAERVGAPAASRAVGRANATNPIPVIVPCHRVIGADGSLTGYGGGIERKEALLHLEGALLVATSRASRAVARPR